jgi:hypothetical protein
MTRDFRLRIIASSILSRDMMEWRVKPGDQVSACLSRFPRLHLRKFSAPVLVLARER